MDDSMRAPQPPTAGHDAYERQLTMNRARRWQRLASETPEQREARPVRRRRRLASETAEPVNETQRRLHSLGPTLTQCTSFHLDAGEGR